jgi:hypothetical protein
LTADEYKLAVTGPWAIIVCVLSVFQILYSEPCKIPVVWERFLAEAQQEYHDANLEYESGDVSDDDEEPSPRMLEGEDENFLSQSRLNLVHSR